MADPIYEIKTNPTYETQIRALQDNDPSRATTVFNPLFTTLINNTHFTKLLVDEQVKLLNDMANGHIETGINTVNGVHGIRYHNDMLSYWNGTAWIEIETGNGGVAPGNVSNITIVPANGSLKIKWSDPSDEAWSGTKVVMKAGSYPNNEKDGTIIVDNKIRNNFEINPFIQSGLTNGTKYYFGFFSYSVAGAVNYDVINRKSGIPLAYKIMTVNIDLSNSNPSTCVTYADNATEMIAGSTAWDEFFGHYPVLLKNGVEVGKLKATNFTQFEDGTAANISSGDAGDVMIAFPRRGLKINTVGNILKISMTEDLDNTEFKYYAHTRGSTRKEKFYIGAYKGYVDSNSKLRSLSGKKPTVSMTIDTSRAYAQALGSGYENSGFYQLIYRQVMYILKYKNLNSQTIVGKGFVNCADPYDTLNTGGTNVKGMDFGETTGKLQMKLFGIEDFWGNINEWIDGVVISSTRDILTSTTPFNTEGNGYTNQGQAATDNKIGYMLKPQGTSEVGFIIKELGGSSSTYFCDYGYMSSSSIACYGDRYNQGEAAGVFFFCLSYPPSFTEVFIGGRLMYL